MGRIVLPGCAAGPEEVVVWVGAYDPAGAAAALGWVGGVGFVLYRGFAVVYGHLLLARVGFVELVVVLWVIAFGGREGEAQEAGDED